MPSLKDLRYRIEYLGLRLIAALVRAAPLDVGVNVSAKAWRIIAPYDRRHQRALDNLAIAFPEKSPEEREAIALGMWENLGRVMAETMQIDRIIADPARIQIVSRNIHDRYRNKLGAAIGVSLHMGNWELAIWPFTLAGNKPAAVYRTVKNPYVDKYLRDLRRDLYPGGLLGKGRIDGSIEEGQTHGAADHGFRAQGRTAGACLRPARPHGAAGAVLRPAGKVRDHPGHDRPPRRRAHLDVALPARGQAEPLPDRAQGAQSAAHGQARPTTSRPITAAMQKQFEAWIREAPDQWSWNNRRWG